MAEEKKQEWEELAGHPWQNPIASRIYKNYNKQLDIWSYDHRGSLNAVYAFLRSLGVRWYMPGELGEIVPETRDIALPEINQTVRPAYEVRSVSRPMISSNEIEDALWYLRIGANDQYGILHHGQRNLTEHPEQRPPIRSITCNWQTESETPKAKRLMPVCRRKGFSRRRSRSPG